MNAAHKPARPLGFAIVGTGSIAHVHAAAIRAVDGAELRAVFSRSSEMARRFAEAHGVSAASDLRALIERSDVDVLCIATPTGAHGAPTIAALEAGKHVLCEKPLEVDLARVDAMIDTARQNNRILACVFQARFGPGAQRVKQAIEEGRFGRLTLCSAYVRWWRTQAYYDENPWRGTWGLDGGGALMNQGIHAVDLLQWFAGLPESVSAFSGTLAHERMEAEDTLVANLRFPGGALGSIESATSAYPGTARRIEISGTDGTVVLEDDRIAMWSFRDARAEDEALQSGSFGGQSAGGASDPRAISGYGHQRHVADLVAAIRENRAPAIPGDEGRRAVHLITAIYRSVAAGAVVRL